MRSFNEIYYSALRDLKSRGKIVNSVRDKTSVGSLFGTKERDFVEIQGYSFVLDDPRNRLVYSASRKLSLGFNFANFLWFLSGRNDVDTISFYNKRGKAFANGKYYEAAFGERLLGEMGLLHVALNILKKDPNSRRSLIPIFHPADLINLPFDTPCAGSVQLMIRDEHLDFHLHMRSQSALMVMPYDVFLFTMLQELCAMELDVDIGKFYYHANSFHYYKEEEKLLDTVLLEPVIVPSPMASMSKLDEETKSFLINWEANNRLLILSRGVTSKGFPQNLSTYWRSILEIISQKANIEHIYDHRDWIKNEYTCQENLFV